MTIAALPGLWHPKGCKRVRFGCPVADVLPSLPKLSHAERRRAVKRAVNAGLVIERRGSDGRMHVAVASEGWRRSAPISARSSHSLRNLRLVNAGRGSSSGWRPSPCAWPWLLIAPIVVLTGAGIFAATRLDTNAGTDTLVSKGSSEYKATQDFHQKFGDEPVIVLAKEDLRRLVLTKDLEPLFELEECFAGGTQLAASLPHRRKEPLPPVCDQIAKLHPSQLGLRARRPSST